MIIVGLRLVQRRTQRSSVFVFHWQLTRTSDYDNIWLVNLTWKCDQQFSLELHFFCEWSTKTKLIIKRIEFVRYGQIIQLCNISEDLWLTMVVYIIIPIAMQYETIIFSQLHWNMLIFDTYSHVCLLYTGGL